MVYHDRLDAGRALAEHLDRYRDQPEVLVLALPRGGVPVAYEVAKGLHAPLDVFLVRKLGLPGHEELAMGAVATGNVQVLNDEVVQHVHVPARVIRDVARRELAELRRQQDVYRRGRPDPPVKDKIIILVDDGLATGSTMRAAVKPIRQQQPKRIVVAVPVGAAETCTELGAEVDEMICASAPQNFLAVAMWYDDFSPTTDATVQSLLKEAAHRDHTPAGVP